MGEAGWSLPILRKGWSKMEHNVVLTMRGITMTFPGMEIRMDPLSISISCHIGPGALAVACSRKIPELEA